MTEEQDRAKKRLAELHEQENQMNKDMGDIDKQIATLIKKKSKLQKRISGNMLFCNRLLNNIIKGNKSTQTL